jgi:riboflavin synthase
MFTGIIEEIGAVSRRSGSDMTILAHTVLEDVQEGDSIAINGACMTVVTFDAESFVVQVSPESFTRTTLGSLRVGDAVNLERAMAIGQRVGGHFVQGHVDGVGKVESVVPQGEFQLWNFRAPTEVAKYLVPKGSVSIEGISLTVVDPKDDAFSVAIIPATIEKTTLGMKGPGDEVNMEADMFGKHIFHYLKGGSPKEGLTLDHLQRHGFA